MAARTIRVLGPLSVEIGGQAQVIASATQRKILAVLVANADQVVSIERLADEVWDGNPPASARASLQTYLYRLRSTIGEEVIVTRPPGYLVDSSTFQCDANLFQTLEAQAHSAEPLACIDRADEALGLWTGKAYAEFHDTAMCRPSAVRLEELRLALIERRIEALLDVGLTDRAIADAEALCSAEPLREHAHAAAMRGLATKGRMAEALRVFESYRRFLAEETGLAPSGDLQKLAQKLIQESDENVSSLADLSSEAFLDRVVQQPTEKSAPEPERMLAGIVYFAFERVNASLSETSRVSGEPGRLSGSENRVTARSVRTEVARRAEALVREVLGYRGGYLVNRLGDGFVCRFSGAGEAVLAAIETRQALASDRRRFGGASVGLARIGVSAGEIEISALGVSGAPVDEAIGLARIAQAGAIVASPVVEHAMNQADGIVFGLMPERIVHGFGRPISPRSVDWGTFPNLAERLGLPARLSRPTVFVGQETAVQTLLGCLDTVEQGAGMLLSLIGPPGIGKTSLVISFAEEAANNGFAVLFGLCRRDPHLPFEPFVNALEDLVRRHPGGAGILGPYRKDLQFLLAPFDQHAGLAFTAGPSGDVDNIVGGKELSTSPATIPGDLIVGSVDGVTEVGAGLFGGVVDIDLNRGRAIDAMVQVLRSLSEQLPVLLVLDDLHWADAATVDLLQTLLSSIQDRRILVMVALREYESVANSRLATLYQSVAGTVPSRRVSVQGISVDAVAVLVRQAKLSHLVGLAESIHARTGGNPFLVGELLADASSTGSTSPMGLNGRVQDAIAGRLGTVGEACRKVLSVAAVAGSEFDPVVVASAIGSDSSIEEVFDLFDEAVASGNIRDRQGEELSLTFDHELIRESLLGSMTQLRKTRLHREIGLAIERRHPTVRPSDLPNLARHFTEAASLGESGRACTYNNLAAEWALNTSGDSQAIDYFRTALDFCDDDVARAEIMVGLGEALRRRGDRSYRRVLGDAAAIADANDAIELMARAVLTDYRGTFGMVFDIDEPRVKRLRRAVERIGDSSPAILAELLAALAVELVWSPQWQESLSLSQQALELARSVGDDALLVRVLQLRQWVVYHPTSARVSEATELALLCAHSNDLVGRFEAAGHATFTYLRAGEPTLLMESLELARWLAQRINRPAVDWMLALRESAVAMLECRFNDLEGLIESSFTLGTATSQPDAALQQNAQRFWVDFETQEPHLQRESLRGLLKYKDRMPLITWPSYAFRLLAVGLRDEAEAMFRVLEPDIEQRPLDIMWLWNTCQLSSLALEFAPHLVHKLIEQLEPHRLEIANTVFGGVGPVARFLGLMKTYIGSFREAKADLILAREVAERMKAVSWKAWVNLDLADLIDEVDEGNSDLWTSQELRAEAFETAQRIGLCLLRDRAQDPSVARIRMGELARDSRR